MSEQFTKGPWTEKHIRTDTHGIAWKNIRGGDGCLFAEVCGEANANLIAAAPDMYEALECACDKYCIGYAGDSLVKCEDCIIRKALRKARGETE